MHLRMNDVFCIDQQPGFENHGISLAKTDPTGRMYAGTFKPTICDPALPADCSLYSYDRYRGVQQHIQGLKLSAGMAWNRKKRCLYHIGACLRNVRKFSWNPPTGVIMVKQNKIFLRLNFFRCWKNVFIFHIILFV